MKKRAATYSLRAIGHIRSSITRTTDAPLFYDEGAPEAFLEIFPRYRPALHRLRVGDGIVVITWLHKARRNVLKVHPRGRRTNPLTGVFLTRSPDRPNPLGLHRAVVVEVLPEGLRIDAIEAIDGTPVLDIKPVVNAQEG